MLLANFRSMVFDRHLVLVQLGSSHEQAIEDETVLSGKDISVRYSMLLNQLDELGSFIVRRFELGEDFEEILQIAGSCSADRLYSVLAHS